MKFLERRLQLAKDGQKVKLLGFDDRGKVRLSMRVVDQETGEDLEGKKQAAEFN